MPIRINLLAEQIEAEEARRRDPVKRAVLIVGGLIVFMILWCVSLQLRLGSSRSALADTQAKLQEADAQAKEVRLAWQEANDIDKRMESLKQYAAKRFFWAGTLDAMQRTVLDNVRLVSFDSSQTYLTNAESRLRTNLVFHLPKRSFWQFWGKPPALDVQPLLSNQLAQITNRAEYVTNRVAPLVKVSLDTNKVKVVASVEVVRPATATEKVVLTVDGRDYSPGRRVDEFSRTLALAPYFKDRLHPAEGQGIRLKERGIRPDADPQDPIAPNKLFVPFTIECRYDDRVHANN